MIVPIWGWRRATRPAAPSETGRRCPVCSGPIPAVDPLCARHRSQLSVPHRQALGRAWHRCRSQPTTGGTAAFDDLARDALRESLATRGAR